jgi:hypothetical protein
MDRYLIKVIGMYVNNVPHSSSARRLLEGQGVSIKWKLEVIARNGIRVSGLSAITSAEPVSGKLKKKNPCAHPLSYTCPEGV